MPRYDYVALNQLALNDSGHFVYLSAWQYVACLSIMENACPLYLWTDDQHPLTDAQIDDLEAKLAEVQYQLMASPLTGLITPCCTADLPPGTLLCDGSTYLREDYPALYAAIDPGYHVDADSFVVPDLRDRFVLGAGPVNDPGTTGGSFEHTQTVDELATHYHTTQPHAHAESAAAPSTVTIGLEVPVPAAVPAASTTGFTTVTVDNAGGGQPMDITPPFFALRYVVVAL